MNLFLCTVIIWWSTHHALAQPFVKPQNSMELLLSNALLDYRNDSDVMNKTANVVARSVSPEYTPTSYTATESTNSRTIGTFSSPSVSESNETSTSSPSSSSASWTKSDVTATSSAAGINVSSSSMELSSDSLNISFDVNSTMILQNGSSYTTVTESEKVLRPSGNENKPKFSSYGELFQNTFAWMNDAYVLSILIPVCGGFVFASVIIVTVATCRCIRRRCYRRRLRTKVLPESVKHLRSSDRTRLLAESSDDEF